VLHEGYSTNDRKFQLGEISPCCKRRNLKLSLWRQQTKHLSNKLSY